MYYRIQFNYVTLVSLSFWEFLRPPSLCLFLNILPINPLAPEFSFKFEHILYIKCE